jgi:hypothetical protein
MNVVKCFQTSLDCIWERRMEAWELISYSFQRTSFLLHARLGSQRLCTSGRNFPAWIKGLESDCTAGPNQQYSLSHCELY